MIWIGVNPWIQGGSERIGKGLGCSLHEYWCPAVRKTLTPRLQASSYVVDQPQTPRVRDLDARPPRGAGFSMANAAQVQAHCQLRHASSTLSHKVNTPGCGLQARLPLSRRPCSVPRRGRRLACSSQSFVSAIQTQDTRVALTNLATQTVSGTHHGPGSAWEGPRRPSSEVGIQNHINLRGRFEHARHC